MRRRFAGSVRTYPHGRDAFRLRRTDKHRIAAILAAADEAVSVAGCALRKGMAALVQLDALGPVGLDEG